MVQDEDEKLETYAKVLESWESLMLKIVLLKP